MTRFAGSLLLLLTTVSVPAAGELGGTLVVANMHGNDVWLIDVATGERRAHFPANNDPHEVALSSDGEIAAVTNYGGQDADGNILQIASVSTGELLRELVIEGYERIHSATFLPGDSLLALTSERTGEVLVVSADDGAVRRKMTTGGRASHMLSPGGPWIYAANIADGSLARVDPEGREPSLVWSVHLARTEGVAATPDGAEGWTGSMQTGTVVGIHGETGEEVGRVRGLSVPYRLAVTPDGATVVVSDPGSGVIGLIDRSSLELTTVDVNAAATAAGLDVEDASPQGLFLSPDSRWAFVSAKGANRVAIVDLKERTVTRFLETGVGPDGLAFTAVPCRPPDPDSGE